MQFLNFLIIPSIAFQGAFVSALTPEQITQIDKLITEIFIPHNNVTGTSLSIVQHGEIVYTQGYGKQDIENGIPATNNTLYSIGSISKSFIATLVLKTLSEQYPQYGESVLDLPISSFQPNFNSTFSDRFRGEETSFRDLLSHRTCLVSTDMDLIFGTLSTSQEYNYRTRYETQTCGHRSYYVYNNALYALAGDLIASFHNGKSLEVLVREFMTEIGMTNSTTVDHSASYEKLPNMAQGYYQKDGKICKMNLKLLNRVAIALGAGGILSTAEDMGKYMAFHLNGGKVGNKQIVRTEALQWMYKPSIHRTVLPGTQPDPGLTGINREYAYGLGLALGHVDGYATIGHAGNWPPYLSDMRFYQYGEDAQQIGVFITTNGPGGIFGEANIPPAAISAAIFDIVRKGNYNKKYLTIPSQRSWQSIAGLSGPNIASGSTYPKISKNDRIEYNDLVGLYGERLSGDLEISFAAGLLQVNFGRWGIGELTPVQGSATKYEIGWKTDILQHWFTFPPDILPVPVFHIDFRPSSNSLYLLMNDQIIINFMRNATVETFPVIPWNPASCGPEI